MTDDPTPQPGDPTPQPGDPARTPAEEQHLRRLLRSGSAGPDGDPFSVLFAVRRRVRRRRTLRAGLAAFAAAGLVSAVVLVLPARSRPTHPARLDTPRTAPVYHLTGALVSFTACSDYLHYVKSEAASVVGPYGLNTTGPMVFGGPDAFGRSDAGPVFNGAEQSALGAAGANSPSTTVAGATGSFSQTNDQVAGVDEPDTVKTNGQVVVSLVGSTFRVLDLQAHVIGSLELSGDTGGGVLLDGQRALVLSSSPTSSPGTVGYVPTPRFGGALAAGYSSSSLAPAFARMAVIDLSDPTHPQVVRTFLFDGQVVAARLVGGQVRLVLRTDGPRIDFATPSPVGDQNTSMVINRRLIDASTLADWLPAWQVQNPDGSSTARQPLSSCSSVARPTQASGLSTVSVFSVDPGAAAPGPATSVVAAGETVYATADHVYVAGPTAGPTAGSAGSPASPANAADPYAGGIQQGCCSVLPPLRAATRIFAFSTPASGPPVFEGAGSVPGWLIDSYALDEDANGLLRVASTAQSSAGTTQSQITVLSASGNELTVVGSVSGLGKGEFIKAVRFIGNRAYVVTFRSFDPLYVVDLTNPRQPALTGELEQPGFSEFLYPLPHDRLLGVGVNITGGEPSGYVLATYDVSDPATPRRLDSSVLASGFQYVAQGYDPHAFLYWPAANLALVALPGDDPYAGGGSATGLAAYQIGAAGRLTHSATLAHGADHATRSVVIDGQVWAFTNGGVVTANLTDLPATTWHGY